MDTVLRDTKVISKDLISEVKDLPKAKLGAFLVFNIIIAPCSLLLLCLLLGALLAGTEGWSLLNGFLYVACAVTGTGPFFKAPVKESLFREICEIVISVIALTVSGGIMGISCMFSIVNDLPAKLGIENDDSVSLLRSTFCVLIAIPAFVIAFGALFAFVFSLLEDLAFSIAFKYIIQTVCGTTLTSASPERFISQLLSMMIAIMALSVTSVVVGIVGSMKILQDTVDRTERLTSSATRKSLDEGGELSTTRRDKVAPEPQIPSDELPDNELAIPEADI